MKKRCGMCLIKKTLLVVTPIELIIDGEERTLGTAAARNTLCLDCFESMVSFSQLRERKEKIKIFEMKKEPDA